MASHIHFEIDSNEHRLLQEKLGKGNVAGYFKKCARRVIESTNITPLDKLERKLELLKIDKEKADTAYFETYNKIETLKAIQRAKELRKLDKNRKEEQKRIQDASTLNKAIRTSGILTEVDLT